MSDAKYQRVPLAAMIGTAVAVSDEHADNATKSVPSSCSPPSSRSSSSTAMAAACRTVCRFLLLLALSTTVLAALLLGAAYHGGRHLVRVMGETIVPAITSDRPLDLPDPVRLSESELRDVEGRLDEFRRALFHRNQREGDSGDLLPIPPPLRDLVLTEREINGLICRDGGGGDGDDHRHHRGRRRGHHHHHRRHGDGGGESGMCGKVHVTLSEHEITASFSIPAEDYYAAIYGPSSSDRRESESGSASSGRYLVGTQSLLVEPLPTTTSSSIRSDADREGEPSGSSASTSAYSVRAIVVAGHPDDGNNSEFPLLDGTAKVELLAGNGDDDDGAPLLDVRITSAQLFGWAATDAFVKRFFGGRNWAAAGGVIECRRAKAALGRIEGVDVEDGKVIVRVRRSARTRVVSGDAGGQQREDEADATEVGGETRGLPRTYAVHATADGDEVARDDGLAGMTLQERRVTRSTGSGDDPPTGPKTDETFLSFTDSFGIKSKYHRYAAGLDWSKSVGLLVYTDGSGEYGLKNPGRSYLLAGSEGLIKVAKRNNMVLLTPLAPGRGCPDGDGTCWYEKSSGISPSKKARWSADLVRYIQNQYKIDKARVAFGGYSSGAQWTTEYFGPRFAAGLMTDGVAVAISFGGSPKVTPNFTSKFKANVPFLWDVGRKDPAYKKRGKYGVMAGYKWYKKNGFRKTKLNDIPGVGHDRSGKFGAIMESAIKKHVKKF